MLSTLSFRHFEFLPPSKLGSFGQKEQLHLETDLSFRKIVPLTAARPTSFRKMLCSTPATNTSNEKTHLSTPARDGSFRKMECSTPARCPSYSENIQKSASGALSLGTQDLERPREDRFARTIDSTCTSTRPASSSFRDGSPRRDDSRPRRLSGRPCSQLGGSIAPGQAEDPEIGFGGLLANRQGDVRGHGFVVVGL